MQIDQLYSIFREHPHVVTDSRKIVQNCLFFALKGEKFNGNDYAGQALTNGAAYAIIDEKQSFEDHRLIYVDDVLQTLQKLANYHRRSLAIPVLAITGSNGKTTTKELAAAVLAKKYNIRFTQGNLNNHIGVPLTLLTFDGNTELGVVEMGANHPGEIDFLCRIAEPDFGLITNVGKAHLEGFGSFEMVIKTKSELYRYLEEKMGMIFIHRENRFLMEVTGNLTKITYGQSEECWQRGEITGQPPFLNIRAWFPAGILYIHTKLTGNYNLENVLAAAAIGRHFEVDPLRIKEAIEDYMPTNNRSQFVKSERNQIIMDAYNANPTSMQASLNNLFDMSHPRKVVILGDMLELGSYAGDEHQKIVDMVRDTSLYKVFLVGELFSQSSYPDNFRVFRDTISLNDYLKSNPLHECLILIKGSRGIGLERIAVTIS